ncbi:MAG: hypothetical protein GKS06_13360 [Acidobacteria bacterium]|nr:hypothetical protein [Acidobacteriota bacterium]
MGRRQDQSSGRIRSVPAEEYGVTRRGEYGPDGLPRARVRIGPSRWAEQVGRSVDDHIIQLLEPGEQSSLRVFQRE